MSGLLNEEKVNAYVSTHTENVYYSFYYVSRKSVFLN